MPIKTNLTDLSPSRLRASREIKLVSGGYFDREHFPTGKITVYPWDWEVSEWFLQRAKAGTAPRVWEVLPRVVDLKGSTVDRFVMSEVPAILLVARALVSDGVFQYVATCPNCQTAEQAQISLPEELEPVGAKATDYEGLDKVTLARSKDEVGFRPLTVADIKFIEGREDDQVELCPESLAYILRGVVTVGGGTPGSVDELVQWYRALHPGDQQALSAAMDAASPHLNSNLPHQCDKCRTKFIYPVTFDDEFFRSGGLAR